MGDSRFNEDAYWLSNYNFLPVKILDANFVGNDLIMTITRIRLPPFKVSSTRIALPEERICAVWEEWRPKNNVYRIERALYPEHRIYAKNVCRVFRPFIGCGWVKERTPFEIVKPVRSFEK